MVRDLKTIGVRNLVRTNIKAAIHRRRVAIDDLAAEPLGERERHRALSRGGRAENGQDERPRHGSYRTRISTYIANATTATTRPSRWELDGISKMHECKNAEMHECRNARMQMHECKHSGLPARAKRSDIPAFLHSCILAF